MDAEQDGMNSTMRSLLEEFPALFYIDAVWLGLMSVVGVLGNLAALSAVATTPSLRTCTQLHITILAAMDLIITLVIIPSRIATEYHSGRWPGSERLCHLLAYLAIFFVGFSLQQLVYLAQVRYLRVARSDALYRKFTSKPAIIGQQIIGVLLTCVLTLLPTYSDFGSVGYNPKMHFCIFTGRNQQLLAALSILSALGMIPAYYGLTFLHVRAHRRKVGRWRRPSAVGVRPPITETLQPETPLHRAVKDTVMDTVAPDEEPQDVSIISNGTSNGMESHKPKAHGNSPKQRPSIPEDLAVAAELTADILPARMKLPVKRPLPAITGAPRKQPRSTGPSKENVKITRNLLLIFCAYITCWLPWCIWSIIEPIVDLPIPVYHVIINMVYTNSCINPYLYAFTSRNYKNAFKRSMIFKWFFRRH